MASVFGSIAILKTPKTKHHCSSSSPSFFHSSTKQRISRTIVPMATTKKLVIKVENNPPESKLTQLGVRNWPKWGCSPSKFPWTYESKEMCFLLKGKVKVTPEGSSESVEFGAGDFVEFPKGMTCTWDVSVAIDKHYKFE